MNRRIMFVDDDANLLASYQRQLRKHFEIDTALGGEEALKTIIGQPPYAVVISDLKMPGMDGIQLLSRVRDMAPDTVRMMLTGHGDMQNAIKAVNEGSVFRFLTKPCDPEILAKALVEGLKQYRLVMAERELLEKTLSGSVAVLGQVLAMINPEFFGRASRIKHYMVKTGQRLNYPRIWELEAAATLSQIGCIILPEEILTKVAKGQRLAGMESKLFARHPGVAADLLAKIPRLEGVTEIVTYQEKRFDGSGIPEDPVKERDIHLGARILKLVLDFDVLESVGNPKSKCIELLSEREGWYDPEVFAAFHGVVREESKYELIDLEVQDLKPFMILAQDVHTRQGRKMVTKGMELSESMIQRLRSFARSYGIQQPIKVIVPL